jgi:hypothetical protein
VKVQVKRMTLAIKDKRKESPSNNQKEKEEARAENLPAKDERRVVEQKPKDSEVEARANND